MCVFNNNSNVSERLQDSSGFRNTSGFKMNRSQRDRVLFQAMLVLNLNKTKWCKQKLEREK